MADVVVTIPVSDVSYTTWLRTSYIGMSLVTDDGTPLIQSTELGVDHEDAFANFMEEAAREVEKLFISRQGDATGVPFEYDGTNAIYRFNEATPLLNQAAAIKSTLDEDVKNALFTYVTLLWFKLKGNDKQTAFMMEKFITLGDSIKGHLHRLHD
jgi:hypothetical protein